MKAKNAVFNFIKGIVIGVANIIPGVSGGTMAVIMNVYDTLLAVLSFDIPVIKKKWREVLFLVLGTISGVLALSFVMEFLLDRFPTQCNWFFTGIIIGSVPFIYKKADTTLKKLSVSKLIAFFTTLLVMIVIFVFSDTVDKEGGVVLAANLGSFMYMILAGVVGAFCMIVPGISGSFMLVVIGAYATVISVINTVIKTLAGFIGAFDTSVLGQLVAPLVMIGGFAIGMVVGLVLGAKLIKLLLKKFPAHTYLAILGLVLGSVPYLLGWQGLIWAAVLGAGFAISYIFGKSDGKTQD